MAGLIAFALTHIRGILITVAIGIAIAAVWGAKSSYDEGKRDEGRAEVRAEFSEQAHRECGETAETPKDCFTAGVKSVTAEYTTKIEQANRTINDQSAALATSNAAVERMKVDGDRRQKAAAQAIAEAESRVKFASEVIGKIEKVQPTGATPCESACQLLRSSW